MNDYHSNDQVLLMRLDTDERFAALTRRLFRASIACNLSLSLESMALYRALAFIAVKNGFNLPLTISRQAIRKLTGMPFGYLNGAIDELQAADLIVVFPDDTIAPQKVQYSLGGSWVDDPATHNQARNPMTHEAYKKRLREIMIKRFGKKRLATRSVVRSIKVDASKPR